MTQEIVFDGTRASLNGLEIPESVLASLISLREDFSDCVAGTIKLAKLDIAKDERERKLQLYLQSPLNDRISFYKSEGDSFVYNLKGASNFLYRACTAFLLAHGNIKSFLLSFHALASELLSNGVIIEQIPYTFRRWSDNNIVYLSSDVLYN